MSATFERVQGDVNDTLVVQLDGVADFTASEVAASVWTVGTTPTTLPATVVNSFDRDGVACGQCTVDLGGPSGWLATALGNYLLEYAVTFSNGSQLTWPERAPDQLIVRADA